MEKKKILVFTGAGISADSGIKTFRDNDGLWNEFKIEEVASIDGWNADPRKVMDFYNMRKNELKTVLPNPAHFFLAELEKDFNVTVVTQNVDDLHERAGSSKIVHLHGKLTELVSIADSTKIYPYNEDLKIGDKDDEGNQLRPNIVWFGEALDPLNIYKTERAAREADICIVVGTSMQVSPANEIPWMTAELTPVYYIDPGARNFFVPKLRIMTGTFEHIKKTATEGLPEVIEDIKKFYLK